MSPAAGVLGMTDYFILRFFSINVYRASVHLHSPLYETGGVIICSVFVDCNVFL